MSEIVKVGILQTCESLHTILALCSCEPELVHALGILVEDIERQAHLEPST